MYAVTMTTSEAAIYVRISADPAGERAGVQRQRRECEELAARLGLTVVRVFEDNDVSAYSGRPRPAFEQLMSVAGRDFQHVIAWSSDRLYRRMTDLTRIVDELAGVVRVHTVAGGDVDLETSEGILRAQMLGSVAEFESRRKAERVAARARQRAESGHMTAAHRPFGWQWRTPCPGGDECRHRTPCSGDGLRAAVGSRSGLRIDPEASLLLIDAYERVKAGATLRATWQAMRADAGPGVRVPTESSGLGAVLRNPRHAGLVALHGQIVADAADGQRIIDPDTWHTVHGILSDPSRRTAPGRSANTLLGKTLFCHCGSTMASQTRAGGTPNYICTRNQDRKIARHLVDEPVLDLVGRVLAELADRGLLLMPDTGDAASDQLRQRAADIETRLDALAGLLSAGELDPADYATATRKLRSTLTEITEQLTRRAGRPAVAALSGHGDGVRAAWDQVVADARKGHVDPLRGIMAELLHGIDLQRDRRVLLRWQEWVGPAPAELALPGQPLYTTVERREAVARLHDNGMTQVAIAAELSVNRTTVRSDLRALGRLAA